MILTKAFYPLTELKMPSFVFIVVEHFNFPPSSSFFGSSFSGPSTGIGIFGSTGSILGTYETTLGTIGYWAFLEAFLNFMHAYANFF